MASEKDGVLFVLERIEKTKEWLFHQAFLYVEEPFEPWEIDWALKMFETEDCVHPHVIMLCDRIRADASGLFYKSKDES